VQKEEFKKKKNPPEGLMPDHLPKTIGDPSILISLGETDD